MSNPLTFEDKIRVEVDSLCPSCWVIGIANLLIEVDQEPPLQIEQTCRACRELGRLGSDRTGG